MIFLVPGVTDAEELCRVQSTAANIREESGEGQKKIGTLRKGELILVREWKYKSNDELKDNSKDKPKNVWARFDYKKDKYKYGWVHGKLIHALSARNKNAIVEYEQLMENFRELGKSMIQAILILFAINGYMIKLMVDHVNKETKNKNIWIVSFAVFLIFLSIVVTTWACFFANSILDDFISKFKQIKPILQLEEEKIFTQAQTAIKGFRHISIFFSVIFSIFCIIMYKYIFVGSGQVKTDT